MNKKEIYEKAMKSCIICNSCRYCEGLCVVFPAMEKRREFSLNDVDYLANLCHQCSECFYDCQYAPPHEFNVSIPVQFAKVRKESYKKYAFPNFLAFAFDKNALLSSFILILALFIGFLMASSYVSKEANGDFFAIVPYEYMIYLFSTVSVFILLALGLSVFGFCKAIGCKKISFKALFQSFKDVLTMKYLGGHNSEGCTYPNDDRSNIRRYFHHFTAYGFFFCFIATTLGAFYHHFLGVIAPYDFTQLPKIFGTIGGVFLCVGTFGLFILKLCADKNIVDKDSLAMDYAFLAMLFIASLSGLVLMVLRQTAWLNLALYFHLSAVLAFFIMIPYSKFVHIFYRFIALLKYNAEES